VALSPLTIVYTEKNPPDQIESEFLAVNCGKMPINFAGAVKNFHNLELGWDVGDWAGLMEGNWTGDKLEVNRKSQMVNSDPWSLRPIFNI
jgi:hypothetical protein